MLVAAVAETLVVLAPRKFSSFAADEAIVLTAALVLVALVNLVVLRRIVRPLEILTSLARRVDLTRPGARMPGATASSEAGELALTFNEMLARLESERRDATGRVLEAQESERLRIALELHDQVGQELTAVLLGLSRISTRASGGLEEDALALQDAVRSTLTDVRRIALELRPEALDDLGLASALAVLADRFSQRLGLEVSEHIPRDLPALSPDVELVLYRVAQEALTNVARHSASSRAELTIECDRDELRLIVRDDGLGLPPGHMPGTGMRGMQERAALIGASLKIRNRRSGSGCEVWLEVAL